MDYWDTLYVSPQMQSKAKQCPGVRPVKVDPEGTRRTQKDLEGPIQSQSVSVRLRQFHCTTAQKQISFKC